MGSNSTLTQSGNSTVFRLFQGHMTQTWKSSILFWHVAMNCSSVRPPPHEESRTTSPTKSRDEILRPSWKKPSATRLHLEILSIKIMNRIGNKKSCFGWIQHPLMLTTNNWHTKQNLTTFAQRRNGLYQTIYLSKVKILEECMTLGCFEQ